MVAETVLTMPPTEALTPSAVARMPSTRTSSWLTMATVVLTSPSSGTVWEVTPSIRSLVEVSTRNRLAITTHSTTTRAPTRKATIVQAMASRLTGSAPRCPSGPERSSLAGPTRSGPRISGGSKLEPPGVYPDGLGAGWDRVLDEVSLADQGRGHGGPGGGDSGAEPQDLVQRGREGGRVTIDPGRQQGAEDGDADGDPDLAEGVVDPRGHAAAGGRDDPEGGEGHGRVGQADPDPEDQQPGQHDRPGRGRLQPSDGQQAGRAQQLPDREGDPHRQDAGEAAAEHRHHQRRPGQGQQLEPDQRRGGPGPVEQEQGQVQERAEGRGGHHHHHHRRPGEGGDGE